MNYTTHLCFSPIVSLVNQVYIQSNGHVSLSSTKDQVSQFPWEHHVLYMLKILRKFVHDKKNKKKTKTTICAVWPFWCMENSLSSLIYIAFVSQYMVTFLDPFIRHRGWNWTSLKNKCWGLWLFQWVTSLASFSVHQTKLDCILGREMF